MTNSVKKINIFGSTGTIGQNTLSVISQNQEKFDIIALTANKNFSLLIEQAKKFNPNIVVINSNEHYQTVKDALKETKIVVMSGENALLEVAQEKVDFTMMGIVGMAALKPTYNSIQHSKAIGLANKEVLVMAGEYLKSLSSQYDTKILPVDSEHNALFQLLENKSINVFEKLILTASGGPFWNWDIKDMARITPAQAVSHPNWSMGAKISVDSATMVNKGLELIEAACLFDVDIDKMEAVIHPESIIHGMIRSIDGGIFSYMCAPDMKIPIHHTLYWPNSEKFKEKSFNFDKIISLNFYPPDHNKFPALKVAKECYKNLSSRIILNAANEIAVDAFLKNKISFLEIIAIIQESLSKNNFKDPSGLEEIIDIDHHARLIATDLLKKAA